MPDGAVTPVPVRLVDARCPALAATHSTPQRTGIVITGRRSQQFHDLVEGTSAGAARRRRTPTCSTSWAPAGGARTGAGPRLRGLAPRAAARRGADRAGGRRRGAGRRRRAAPAAAAAAAHPPPQPPARGRAQRRRPRRRLGHHGRRRPVRPPRATGLYPLKRGIESAHAQLTFDRAARGRVLLDSASTRLDEVAELSRTGASADQSAETLDAFTAGGGGRLRPADRGLPGDRRPVVDHHASAPSPPPAWRGCGCSRARSRRAPSTSCCRPPRPSTRCSRSRPTPARLCAGPSVSSVPPVLTQAAEAAADPWLVALPPAPATATARIRPRRRRAAPGGRHLPPASVTDPTPAGTRPRAPDRATTCSTPCSTSPTG